MSENEGQDLPERPDRTSVPRVGVDEWVASHEARVARRGGVLGLVDEVNRRAPWWSWLLVAVAAASLVPALSDSDYIVRVAVDTTILAMLAVGLNVVVGYAGLLDLGYVAFYGFGAYLFAMLTTEHFGLSWPAEIVIPLVVVASALLGLLIGLPSRRLMGDYLAIVTLFFAQIFVVLTTNANRITLPWNDGPSDITGGPNGITGVGPLTLFGIEFGSIERLLWLTLAVFTLVVIAVQLVNDSRTGRAWRALREDPLAAAAMTIPVNRLKLLAFMFGASIAGLAGTLFASVQENVFPTNFDLPRLIILYAMVILGGVGSLGGVVVGAVIINLSLEVLQQPDDSRLVFYAAIVAVLLAVVRPLWRLGVLLAATAAFGLVLRLGADRWWERGTRGNSEGGTLVGDALDSWVLMPSDPRVIANVCLVLLVVCVLALTVLRGWAQLAMTVPVLYLSVFVWENRLAQEPSVTALLLLGALLVALMTARPQGLFGTARVEIV